MLIFNLKQNTGQLKRGFTIDNANSDSPQVKKEIYKANQNAYENFSISKKIRSSKQRSS